MSAITLKIPDVMVRPRYVNNERSGTREVAMKRFQKVKAQWRVESLPDRHRVWDGVARGQVTLDLDPGKYVWVAAYSDPSKRNNFKYHEELYHEVTEKQWDELKFMRPTIARGIHGMNGLVFHCQFVGCGDQHTSRLSAVLHEARHQGVDLLAEPERSVEVENAMTDYAEEKRGMTKAKVPVTSGHGPGHAGKKIQDG